MPASPDHRSDKAKPEAARRGVRRTVLLLIAVVAAIYAGFILSGAIGQ